MLSFKKARIWESGKRIRFISASILVVFILVLIKGMGLRAEKLTLGNKVEFTMDSEGFYIVDDAAKLHALSQNETLDTEGMKFKLTKDINMGTVSKAATSTFAGELYGEDHRITYSSVNIKTTSASNDEEDTVEGILFGTVTGKVKNLFVNIGSAIYEYNDETQPAFVENMDITLKLNPDQKIEDEAVVFEKIKQKAYEYIKDNDEYIEVTNIDSVGADKYDPEAVQIFYYKQDVSGEVSKESVTGDKKQKDVYFGLVGAVEGEGSIENLYLDGNSIYVSTAGNENCNGYTYKTLEDQDMARYYEVAYKGEKLTELITIPEKYAYLYATEDGIHFDLNEPLYGENGEFIYEQYRDDDGKFWFILPESGDGTERKSLVYGDKDQTTLKQELEEVTKEENVPVQYAFQYAYFEKDNKTTFVPLYGKDGKPLYKQVEGDNGEMFFSIPKAGSNENDLYPVYFSGSQEEAAEKIGQLTKKVNGKYRYQYAVNNDKEVDYQTPLYNGNVPIYDMDKDGKYWISKTEDKVIISLIYEDGANTVHNITKADILEEVNSVTKYAYQFAFVDGKYISEKPLYTEGKAIYKKMVDTDGICWFIDGDKTYPVYDTAGTTVTEDYLSVTVVKTIPEQKKYAYKYATNDDGTFDKAISLIYDKGLPNGKLTVDTEGVYWITPIANETDDEAEEEAEQKYQVYEPSNQPRIIEIAELKEIKEVQTDKKPKDLIDEMRVEVYTAANLYAGAVAGRINNAASISGVIQKVSVKGEAKSEKTKTYKEESILSIGGITGYMDSGAKVRDCYIGNSILAESNNQEKLKSYVANITGMAEDSAEASFIIVDNQTSGTICGNDKITWNFAYTTATSQAGNIFSITQAKFGSELENWKCLTTDITGETNTIYTLNWLFKENCNYKASVKNSSTQIEITLDSEHPNNAQNITNGCVSYGCRKSIEGGETGGTREITSTKFSISNENLGNSAYLYLKHFYCTDGKYYYLKDFSKDNKQYIYPYMEGQEFETVFAGDFIREEDVDYIQITGNMPLNESEAKFYYIINSKKFPVVKEDLGDSLDFAQAADPLPGSKTDDGKWKARLEYRGDTIKLKGFWTFDNKIYPVLESREYDEKLLKEMEPPKEFSVSRYYMDDIGMKPFYTNLPIDQGVQTVYAGQNIVIEEYGKESAERGIEYLYLFSTESNLTAIEDSFNNNRMVYSHDLTSKISNLSVPASYQPGDEFYLHIKKYKKTKTDGGIVSLPLKMAASKEIMPSKASNSVVIDGTKILLDFGELDGADGITGIRYLVSDSPDVKTLAHEDVIKPKAEEKVEITLERKSDEMRKYLYVQYYGKYDTQDICGPLQTFEYTFADKTGNPSITPNTILFTSDTGSAGAFTCYTNTRAELKAAEQSTIVYSIGESETTDLTVTKVSDEAILKLLAEKAQGAKTYEIDKVLYVQSNEFWYWMSDGAQVYQPDKGILLSNSTQETKYIHICAASFEEDKENSDVVHYVYELEPQEETAAPTAVLQTSAEKPATVELNASLFFQTTTPDAEIYYTLDGTVPGTTAGGSTQKYDEQKGVRVEGEYSGLFRVKLIAVKKDSHGEILTKPSETVTFIYRIGEQNTVSAPVSTPTTTEDNPTVLSPGEKILLSSGTNGAVIYYTVDGTEPKINDDGSVSSGSQYDAAAGIIMPEDGVDFFTIKAIAVKSGMKNSAIAQLTFRYPDKVLPPYASPASGVVNSGTAITLTNATEGATIYYEIAYGKNKVKTPTVTSAVFDSEQPFIITQNTTIKAIAVKDGVKSKVETFTYSTSKLSGIPNASIASGSVVSRGTMLNITSENGSAIYYTTDGSDPTEVPNANAVAGQSLLLDGEYGSAITVKACAKTTNKAYSEVATFTYQISKYQGGVTSSLESGSEISSGATVNLISDIGNARIYYTIDGTNPSDGSALGTAVTMYGDPGTIVTVKAMAIPEGVTVDAAGSSMAIFNYKIKDTISAPAASPAGGTLTSQISVTLTAAKGDIYYTTDGSNPTINSARYKDPIAVNKSMVIKAIAATSEGEVSEIATFSYSTAMRAAKPVSSAGDGVLEPGTVITLSSQTNGAVIYYSTDGTAPSMDNLDSLLVYDEDGITINRTVSIRAAAYKDGYLLSNTAAFHYEVTIVPAEVARQKREAEEAAKGLKETDATGLKDKNGSDVSGPVYKGIILKETKFNTQVSAEKGVVPENASLIVKNKKCPDSVLESLQALLGDQYEMLRMYDISLYEETRQIQPNGKLEIGIPIPEQYENAALQIVYVDENGSIKSYETRRSDGMAYAITDHFSSYGLAGVKNEIKNKFAVDIVYLVAGAALIVIAAGTGFFCHQITKKRRPKGDGIFDND